MADLVSVGYLKKCSSRGRPKRQHPDQRSAERQRAGLVHAQIWTWAKSNTYHCNACGWWHAGEVGSANRGKGRKQIAKNTKRRADCQ